jgi:hypothetical protein
MTIRNYLRRRGIKLAFWMLPGIVLCVLSSVFTPDSFWLTWFSLATWFAGVVTVIVQMNRTPCPKCRVPLGYFASRAANGWAKHGARCPHCDVSIDEPMGE